MHKSGLGSAGVLARYRGVMRAGSPALQIVKKEPSTLHLPPSTLIRVGFLAAAYFLRENIWPFECFLLYLQLERIIFLIPIKIRNDNNCK